MLIQNPPVEVGGDVWMLGTTAYPVYLVRGQREAAVIEGGISAVGPIVCRQLAALGIAPESVRKAVVTHAHPDHVMAIPQLREAFPDITVVASAAAAAVLSTEKALAFFCQMDAQLTEALNRAGMAVPEPPSAPRPETRIAVDVTVREGDTIALGDASWSVLETPGHSDCSISLYEAARRVLVISDASGYYMPPAKSWWPNYFTGYAAYLQSLERLAEIKAEYLCLSHNGALRGAAAVRTYFADAIAATVQYHNRIVTEAQGGKTVREIAETLGAEIHGQLQTLPLDFFQKNCGLLVKQSLRHAGITV